LILNELISNALKHAFPRGRRGQIHVGLRADRDRLGELTVRDNGVGLAGDPDLRHPSTFGLQLVAMLTEQLGATIDLEHDGGTGFTLRFPVEADPGREEP
jgi:two-component sensor histidine kinase